MAGGLCEMYLQGLFLVSHVMSLAHGLKEYRAIEGFKQGMAWLALSFLKLSQATVWQMNRWLVACSGGKGLTR